MSARTILIVGYGNELRGDDGLGPRVVREIRALNIPGVHCIEAHQLLPELAPELAAHDVVLFVDAIRKGENEPVRVTPLSPTPTLNEPHVSDPAGMLALAKVLYQKCPAAWLITVPGLQFEFSESISPEAEKALKQAVEVIRALVESLR
jgi:hydrogenase maturation protease